MQYTVREWMMDLVVFVDPDMPVTDALATMRRRYINSVIVSKTDTSPDYGILTSRDVSDKIVAADRNPAELCVRDVMSAPIITVRPDQTIQACAQVMRDHHIHHLPVAEESGQLVGMISAMDFLVVAEAMGREGERALS